MKTIPTLFALLFLLACSKPDAAQVEQPQCELNQTGTLVIHNIGTATIIVQVNDAATNVNRQSIKRVEMPVGIYDAWSGANLRRVTIKTCGESIIVF